MDGTQAEISIALLPDTVNEALLGVLADIRKNVTIPGFRKGNAPEDIILKNYRKDAMEQVKQRLVPEAYQRAIEEHKIMPVSYPELSDVTVGPDGSITFIARIDVHPDVRASKYRGIKIKNEKISLSPEELEEALGHIRNMNAEFVDVDRAAEKGDFGICDIEAFSEGKLISKKRENAWVEVDKNASMLGMGEELCGMKKGEGKDIKVTLPEKYPDEKYAGKEAVFHVKMKEVKEKKLPALDDELAKKMGKEKMEDVRQEVSSQLLERKEMNRNINMKNQIMEYLLKKNSFKLPLSMVKRQQEVLMRRVTDDLVQKGMDERSISENRDKLKDRLKTEAENKVKLYFILNDIAKQEDIYATDEEVDEWLRKIADSYGQSSDSVKKYYQENNLIGGVKEQLREDKTLDFLLKEATVS